MAKTSYGEILCVERIQWLLYCIVSIHLYSTSCSVTVYSNQKRLQCKKPRDKRAVLREVKEALGAPVSIVDRVEGRSWLHHTELVEISHHTRKANSDILDVH